jgi:hypothetical protein
MAVAVADDNLRAVLGSLEATFDASIARAEDEAASDLALSLLQDLSLSEAVGRSGAFEAYLPDRPLAPVTEIGEDYAACERGGTVVVPLTRAVLRAAPGGPASERRDRTMLALLRERARRGGTVEVRACGALHRGALARACRDHIVLRTQRLHPADARNEARHEIYIALGAIEELRLPEEDPG